MLLLVQWLFPSRRMLGAGAFGCSELAWGTQLNPQSWCMETDSGPRQASSICWGSGRSSYCAGGSRDKGPGGQGVRPSWLRTGSQGLGINDAELNGPESGPGWRWGTENHPPPEEEEGGPAAAVILASLASPAASGQRVVPQRGGDKTIQPPSTSGRNGRCPPQHLRELSPHLWD